MFVVKRGPDFYFKTQHEDIEAAHVKQMFYQIASKTKTDIQSAPLEDENSVANKDFEILLMLIRGIELTFSSQTSKKVCIKS